LLPTAYIWHSSSVDRQTFSRVCGSFLDISWTKGEEAVRINSKKVQGQVMVKKKWRSLPPSSPLDSYGSY
jgi:hypothetical protein